MTKWVYAFDEVEEAVESVGGDWDATRALLGGKGANLADMTRLDVPVPPGFTITTEACNAYLAAGQEFPDEMWEQVLDALNEVEETTGKTFGDPTNPLLVSCRSGAKFSMPGMMDTVLNIGLNDEVAAGHGRTDRRCPLRLRLLSSTRPDVRFRRAGHPGRAVRGGPSATCRARAGVTDRRRAVRR